MKNDIKQVIDHAIKFVSRDLAIKSACTAAKPHSVMLGDDGRYWIVTRADASRLELAGYEYAF